MKIKLELYGASKDFSNKDMISIDDVLEMKDDIGVMSVNEDMSLYIFKYKEQI